MTLIDDLDELINKYWGWPTSREIFKRCKAALLAAQEMDKQLVKSGSHDANSSECLSCTAQRKFREAMDGKS